MEKRFLVQRKDDSNDEVFVSMMNDTQLINYIDMEDLHGESYGIYEMSEFGKMKQITYVGWQPNCLIELVDENGNIVLSGYGVDH